MEFVLKNEYTADNEERYIVWVNELNILNAL